jgi:hypothetical protein
MLAMGNPIISWFDALDSAAYLRRVSRADEEGRVAEKPEYAIARDYHTYMVWKRTHPAPVSYLTLERAEQLVARGAQKGVLHRLNGWESSPARAMAERLEESAEPAL